MLGIIFFTKTPIYKKKFKKINPHTSQIVNTVSISQWTRKANCKIKEKRKKADHPTNTSISEGKLQYYRRMIFRPREITQCYHYHIVIPGNKTDDSQAHHCQSHRRITRGYHNTTSHEAIFSQLFYSRETLCKGL